MKIKSHAHLALMLQHFHKDTMNCTAPYLLIWKNWMRTITDVEWQIITPHLLPIPTYPTQSSGLALKMKQLLHVSFNSSKIKPIIKVVSLPHTDRNIKNILQLK